jgi:hypothetical protein
VSAFDASQVPTTFPLPRHRIVDEAKRPHPGFTTWTYGILCACGELIAYQADTAEFAHLSALTVFYDHARKGNR